MSVFNFKSMVPITKGWSGDTKYCVSIENGMKYLLRISPIEKCEEKKAGFERMQRVSSLGVPMCQPVEFGVCEEGVYSLQTWIEGNDAEEIVPLLSDKEQYHYGLEAGRILKKIHTIRVSLTVEDWETRFRDKMNAKIQMYRECPIKYENGQVFLDYINTYQHLLKDRPQCYQHGDFHIGNMMLDKELKLTIIDFDRDDYGDPWEEFNRIVWSAQKTPIFSTGMINGYFNNEVPINFWQLLALYISCNTLSSLPWAIRFGQSQIDIMKLQANDILKWYDLKKDPVPAWYRK